MKLVIPTRNRAASLASVLQYLETFYPDTRVLVADGSHDSMKGAVRETVARFAKLSPELLSYPYEVTYFDRLDDVLAGLDDEFVALNADDDYPMIEVYRRGEEFLKDNPDYALAMGTLLVLDLDRSGQIHANIRQVRPINHDTVDGRVRQFTAWTFPLTYAVCRREVLIARQQRARHCVLGELDDLVAGLSDCIEGKVHAIGDISLVLTRHFAQRYLRIESKLEFFDEGPGIAMLARQLAGELTIKGGMPDDAAGRLATEIYARRVGSHLTGIPFHHQAQFINSNIHRHKFLRHQCEKFERMLEAGTPEQQRYGERLRYIGAALQDQASAAIGARVPLPPIGQKPAATPASPPSVAADDDSVLHLIGKKIPLDPATMLRLDA
ncbi:MAG: TIGR00180 family glycosyltransferase [Hyphomicrobiaceae bacterium]